MRRLTSGGTICLVLISLFISALILSLFSQWDHSQRQQPFHMLPRSLYLITFLQIFFPHDVPLMNKCVFFSTLAPALSSSQLLCWFAIFFFFFSRFQALRSEMRSRWPSSSCRRTTGWRYWRGGGGRAASVPKRRTTVPKVSRLLQPSVSSLLLILLPNTPPPYTPPFHQLMGSWLSATA